MKNFFKKLFGKKYPDRANGPSTRHGRVYAGPGFFRNRAEGVYAGPRMRDDESMLCVYAGPPEDLDPDVEDVVLEEVYNGPGMMDEIGWGGEPDPIEEPDADPDTEPVEEPDSTSSENEAEKPAEDAAQATKQVPEDDPLAPEFIEDDPAAPELIDEDASGEESAEEPDAEEPTYDNERYDEDDFRDMPAPNPLEPLIVAAYAGPPVQNVPIGLVYAGPNNMPNPAMQPNPNLLMTMMAYFGPGGPNGPAGMPGMMSAMMMQQPAQPVDPSVDLVRQEHKFCPNCGAVVPPTQKFCNECGTDLSNEPIQKGIAVDAGEETPSGTEE